MKLSQFFPIAATIVCSVTAQGSINGSATDPFILVGDGAGIDELFTTASQNGQNIAVLANENNPLLASNVFIDNESHLMVQPTNTTIFLPVELLNSGGPAKGINAVVVDAGSGTTGFFVSEANCDLFSNDQISGLSSCVLQRRFKAYRSFSGLPLTAKLLETVKRFSS
jgi:hypothetical protein